MRKILAIFAVLAVMCSMLPVSYSYSDIEDEKIDVISNLGLINGYSDGSFRPDDIITRSGFATIAENIYFYKTGKPVETARIDWQKEFFGDKYEDTKLKETEKPQEYRFADIDETNADYESVMTLVNLGYMNGTGERTFSPDEPITGLQVAKVLLDMMGYSKNAEISGGFPSGYSKLSQETKLLTAVGNNETLTRKKLSYILYSCFNIPICTVDYSNSNGMGYAIKQDKDETFLTGILDLHYMHGLVTANEVTALTGSTTGENKIKIGDELFILDDSCEFARDYICRFVKCYYRTDDDDLNNVKYIKINDDVNMVRFNIKDFKSLQSDSITYTSGNRTKTVSIDKSAYIIKNGQMTGSYNESDFDYDNGYVTLLSTDNGGKYNIIIIEGYESVVVNSVYSDTVTISNRLSDGKFDTPDERFSLNDDFEYVYLYDANGKRIGTDSISIGSSLDIVKSEGYFKAVVSKNRIENVTVQKIWNEDDDSYISDGTNSYRLAREFLNAAERPEIKIGEIVTLTLNSFGDVVWIGTDGETSWMYSYAHTFAYDENGDKGYARFYEDGDLKSYNLMNKITVHDDHDIKTTKETRNYFNGTSGVFNLGAYSGVVGYKLNDKGDVSQIQIPLEYGQKSTDGNRLAKILETFDSGQYSKSSYRFISKSWGMQVFVDNNTKILYKNNSKYYTLTPDSFEANHIPVAMTAYGLGTDAIKCTFCVLKGDPNFENAVEMPEVVTSVSAEYYDEDTDDVCIKVVTNRAGTAHTYISSVEDNILNNVPDAVSVRIGKASSHQLVPGDIIRVTADYYGKPVYAEVMYKSDLPDLEYPDTSPLGRLAGTTIGYYDPSVTTGNPYSISDKKMDTNAGVTAGARYALGYVYAKNDGYYTMTTQNILNEEFISLKEMNDKIDSEEWEYAKYAITSHATNYTYLVEKLDANTVNVKTATIDSIRAYKEYYENCSRVFMYTASGAPRLAYIINTAE